MPGKPTDTIAKSVVGTATVVDSGFKNRIAVSTSRCLAFVGRRSIVGASELLAAAYTAAPPLRMIDAVLLGEEVHLTDEWVAWIESLLGSERSFLQI